MRISAASLFAESFCRPSRTLISSSLGAVVILIMMMAAPLFAQGKSNEPTVSADAGSCSAGFLVQNRDHKPLYGAKIGLSFRYGLFGLHRTSLEAYTDATGRVRFEGLPRQPKDDFVFEISHGDLQKTITDNPLATCKAQFTVNLQ